MEHQTQEITAESNSVVAVRGHAVVMIGVSDMERSLRFYKEMLGYKEGDQILTPGVTLEAGDSMIYLTDGHTPRMATWGSEAEISIALAVRGVEEACRKLRDAGVVIVQEFEAGSEFFGSCAIADPDGNTIRLWGKP